MSWRMRKKGVRSGTIANLPTTPKLPMYKMLFSDVVQTSTAATLSGILLDKIPCIELDTPTGTDMDTDAKAAEAISKRMNSAVKRTSNRVLLRTVGCKIRVQYDKAPNNGYIEFAIVCAKTTFAGTIIGPTTEVLQGPSANDQSYPVNTALGGWITSLLKFNTSRYNVLARKRFPLAGPTKSHDDNATKTNARVEYGHNHFTLRWNLPIFRTLQFESDDADTPTNLPIYLIWWWDTYDRGATDTIAVDKSPTVLIRSTCTFKDGVIRDNL